MIEATFRFDTLTTRFTFVVVVAFSFLLPGNSTAAVPLRTTTIFLLQDSSQENADGATNEDQAGAVDDANDTGSENENQQLAPNDDNQPEWYRTPWTDDDVYYEHLHTEPMQAPASASEAIPRVVVNRVRYHIESWTGEHNDPDIVRNLGFDRQYLMANVVTPHRKEVRGSHHAHFDDDDIDFVGGPDINFFCGYVEIQLTPEFKELVAERFVEYQTRRRLYTVGAFSAGLIGLLAISFVYLRLDHATRGFYSRRLLLGAAVVAILVILFCISLLNHV